MDIFGPLCTEGASAGAQQGWQGLRPGISTQVIIPAFPQPPTLHAYPGSPRADSHAGKFPRGKQCERGDYRKDGARLFL